MSAALLRGLGHKPEQQQPRYCSVGVESLIGLAIDIGPDRQRECAVLPSPHRNVTGVAVWQSALHELTRHVCAFNRVRSPPHVEVNIQ